MSPEDPKPDVKHQPDGRAWPAELEYSDWKLWLVFGLLAVVVIAGVFAFGVLSGRFTATHAHADGEAAHAAADPADEILYWTCSMHPQIKLPDFGQCPICFMDLIPVRPGEGDDTDSPQIGLSRRARQLARVETSPVRRDYVTHELSLVGRVTPDETRITHVSSYIPGRLDRLYVNYTGIFVRKGDHLAEIYSPELLVAQQEYLVALGSMDQSAGANNMAADSARAMMQAARRKLELWGVSRDQIEALERTRQPSDHMRIDAPFEGWVIERQGFEGMYVETGTRLFTLADLRTVWVMLDAYELDVGFIHPGQDVEFESEAYPGQVFPGRVSYMDPTLDPATRTVKVRVVVENPELKLRPEMFVRARLKVQLGESGMLVGNALAGKWMCPMHPEVVKDEPGDCGVCGMDLETAESLGYARSDEPPAPALSVPRTAVLLTGKRAVAYVETAENDQVKYEGRVVELGPRAGDRYVVRAGLDEGERVVTRGALMVDSAMQIQAKPSMMQPPEEPAVAEEEPKVESHYVAEAGYHRHMSGSIDNYLALTDTLSDDDLEESASVEAAVELRKSLALAEPDGLQGEAVDLFNEQVKSIREAMPGGEKPSLEELRSHLPALTRAMELYLRSFGHQRSEPVFKAYCPMAFDDKGASWLQAEETIANPYFASKMLRCGEIRGSIATDGEWSEAE